MSSIRWSYKIVSGLRCLIICRLIVVTSLSWTIIWPWCGGVMPRVIMSVVSTATMPAVSDSAYPGSGILNRCALLWWTGEDLHALSLFSKTYSSYTQWFSVLRLVQQESVATCASKSFDFWVLTTEDFQLHPLDKFLTFYWVESEWNKMENLYPVPSDADPSQLAGWRFRGKTKWRFTTFCFFNIPTILHTQILFGEFGI